MKPFVSILIPAYNSERWIADAIQSAVQQTWMKREIIVVDDGSTDQTLDIAERFSSSGVRVVTQPNQGASAARNTALALSQGDYIQWLDADDVLAADKIAKQVQALQSRQSRRTLLSCPWARFYYRTRLAKFTPSPLWRDLTPVEWLLAKMGESHYMQPATWLVSRELTEAAGKWDTRLWKDNDGEYFCRVILASDGIQFVPDAKVFYRRSGFNSVSYVGRSNKKLDSMLLSMKLHVECIRALEDTERVRTACLNYLQQKLIYFHAVRPDIVEQLQELAASVGGRLETPTLPWKYAPIQAVFGGVAAHRLWSFAPMAKQSLQISWDRALHLLENRSTEPAHAYRNVNDTSDGWAQVSVRSLKAGALLTALARAVDQFWT